MALTIYTISDPAVVGSVMTSMAMFFGQDSWVGTAIKLALLISLIVILAKGVLAREGLRLDTLLLQFIIISVAFLPKTTVVIEQFENNAPPRLVDDVPYAIALPGVLAGAFAMFMTQKIETVMSTVDGKYIAPSGELDPFTPARVLMQVAATPFSPSAYVDNNFAQTIFAAGKNCGDTKLQSVKFEKTAQGIGEFAKNLKNDAGVTFLYTDAHPYFPNGGSGELVSCGEIVQYLTDIQNQLVNDDASVFSKAMKGLAETTDKRRYSDVNAGLPSDKDENDLYDVITRVSPASANIRAAAIANVMTYSVLKQGANAAVSIDSVLETQKDLGLFNWAKSESAQSMLVTATAPKFMDILFFIFIASTPIVMFVVAANPASGAKVAGAYILFGLWTQSWIPMMAIISGWYQAEIKNFAGPGVDGLSPEYIAAFMQHVNTSTIAASNMLQSAPYLMFAIMSGSMFALSNMVSKAAPSGDATGMSGGGSVGGGGGKSSNPLGGDLAGMATNPMAMRQQIAQGRAITQGNMSSWSGVSPGGDVNAVTPGGDVNFGNMLSQVSSAALSENASQRSALTSQLSKQISDLAQASRSGAVQISGQQVANYLRSTGHDATYNASNGVMTVDGKGFQFSNTTTNANSAATSQKAELFGGFKMPGGKNKQGEGDSYKPEVSGSGGGGLGGSLEQRNTEAAAAGLVKNQTTNQNGQVVSGVATTDGANASIGNSGNRGGTYQDAGSRAKSALENIGQTISKMKALDDSAQKIKQAAAQGSAGLGASIKFGDISNLYGALNKGAASGSAGEAQQRLAQTLGGAVAGEHGAAIMQRMAQEQKTLGDQFKGTHALSNDQIASQAFLRAAKSYFDQGNQDQKMAALGAIAKLAEASGVSGVSPEVMKGISEVGNINKEVDGKIDAAKQEIQPAADKVEGQAKNIDKDMAAVRTQAEGAIAAGRAEAESKLSAAEDGMAAVYQEGKIKSMDKAEEVAKQILKNADNKNLVADYQNATEKQAWIPEGNRHTADRVMNDANADQRAASESRERQKQNEIAQQTAGQYYANGGTINAKSQGEFLYQGLKAKGKNEEADKFMRSQQDRGVDTSAWASNFKEAAGAKNNAVGWTPPPEKNDKPAGDTTKEYFGPGQQGLKAAINSGNEAGKPIVNAITSAPAPAPAPALESGGTPAPAPASESGGTPAPAPASESGGTPAPAPASESGGTPAPASGGSDLPTLGGGNNGIDLTNNSGGSSQPPSSPQSPQSSKPNQKGVTGGDSQPGNQQKIPGR